MRDDFLSQDLIAGNEIRRGDFVYTGWDGRPRRLLSQGNKFNNRVIGVALTSAKGGEAFTVQTRGVCKLVQIAPAAKPNY